MVINKKIIITAVFTIVVLFLVAYYFLVQKITPADIRYSKFGGKPVVMLKVPFIPQVSQGSDELSSLGCEEASALMSYRFKSGLKENGNAKSELNNLIESEKKIFGGHVQIGSERLGSLIEYQYRLSVKHAPLNSLSELKTELKNGRPVILPVIADHLDNPFYSEKGYHMIVLVGYNDYGFWVHDPGTDTGSNFFYNNKNIINAAWDVDTRTKTYLTLGEPK